MERILPLALTAAPPWRNSIFRIGSGGECMATPSVADSRAAEAPEDAELVERVARGDRVAFERLFHRYRPRLRRFVERMTRRPQLVDEIVDDTMLIVWRKAGSFNLRSKVSTWIIAIAWRRGLKAVRRADVAIEFEPDAVSMPAEAEPEQIALRRERQARLGRALGSLSPEQRAVVELTYFEGRSYREIAAILGCPVDTVKTRMFHARRRLKALLADGAEEAA
jgi:RNA polymerase sigma factor (sigma-70 family)